MSIFDRYDRVIIVNLPSRKDRRRYMKAELAKVGLADDPRVHFFPAIRVENPGPFRRPGSHGCFISHRRILEDAARERQSVVILQDDCQFLPAIHSYEAPPCDIFYGGYHASDPNDPYRSDIIGAHFMGFSAQAAYEAARYLASFLLEPQFPGDALAARAAGYDHAIRPPIDGAMVWFRRAYPQLRTEFAMLSQQRSSRTDIGQRSWFDQIPLVRETVELLRAGWVQTSAGRPVLPGRF